MEFIVIVIFIIVFVIKQVKKAADGSSSSQNANSRAPQASSPAYRYAAQSRQQTANRYSGRSPYTKLGSANVNNRDGRVYASIDFDNTHYHAEGFDFDCCISFKGLPPGTDELAVLIASNNRHERELAKLLKERQA